MKLNELEIGKKKTVLVYGDSGSGKTCFATSFPTPMFVADFDNKISSAAAFHAADKDRVGQIDFEQFNVDKSAGFGSTLARRPFQRFIKTFNEIGQTSSEKFPYKTFVLDSITTFTQALMKECVEQHPSKRQEVGGVKVPNLKDYQLAINYFKSVVSEVLKLPCHVVMTAHIAVEKDELEGRLLRRPMLFGKDLPGWLPIVFEEVYRTYAVQSENETKFLAQTKPDQQFSAIRSQIRNLPNPLKLSYQEMEKFL